MLNIFSKAPRLATRPLLFAQQGQRAFHDKKYENVLYEQKEGSVALVQMNRPKSLNALCKALYDDLHDCLSALDQDDEVRCIVLTGAGEKAFAAGADIKEMSKIDFPENYKQDMLTWWDNIAKIRKPILGAINGYALGGGCELAMMCDILYASENAKFGQPEITLATIPGMGGSQRMTKAIGKSRAMELILTGDFMGVEEAAQRGLVSKVCKPEHLIDESLKTAKKIASFSLPISIMCKEAVNKSYETTLEAGLQFERRLFHASFATEDRKEGMNAFVEKRKPEWKHR